jgi:hypothetical protein
MKILNDFERGWISAAIDGEGCLSIRKDNRAIAIYETAGSGSDEREDRFIDRIAV